MWLIVAQRGTPETALGYSDVPSNAAGHQRKFYPRALFRGAVGPEDSFSMEVYVSYVHKH